MRSVTYKSVQDGVAIRMGLDPRSNVNANVAQAICEYINSRTRFGWEKTDWPEMVIIEARTPSSRLIAWAQGGQKEISDVFKVYRADPKASPPPLDVYYWLDQDGIHIGATEQIGSQVWVKFRMRPPVFTSVPWVSGSTYATGALAYDPADGNVYKNTTGTNTTTAPSADSSNWAVVPFPYVISEYVKAAAQGDALREDGQTEKAMVEDKRADGAAMQAANAVAAPEFDLLTQNIKQAARGAAARAEGGASPQ